MDWKSILLQWQYYPPIYRFTTVSIKMFMLSCSNRKIFPKIHVESQGTPDHQNHLEKENTEGFRLPDFETDYKVSVIKMVWYGPKNGHRSME